MDKIMRQEELHKKGIALALERQQVASVKEVDNIVGVQDEKTVSDSEEDPDYIPYNENRKPKKLSKMMLELPTKDLNKEIAVLADRLKISHRAATSLFAKIISSGGEELKNFS